MQNIGKMHRNVNVFKINKLCEDPDSNTAKQLGNVQHVLHL